MKHKIKKGSEFYAIIKYGWRSKTFGGKEMAGKQEGPFKALKVNNIAVETEDRIFRFTDWDIVLK